MGNTDKPRLKIKMRTDSGHLWAIMFSCFLATLVFSIGPAQGDDFVEIPGIGTRILASHPRLFITNDTLTLLRQRVQTTHSLEYKYIVDWCTENIDITLPDSSGYTERAFAFLYQINKDGMISVPGVDYQGHTAMDYANEAKSLFSVHNKSTYMYAIVYDWIYDLFTDEERKAIFENWVNGQRIDGGGYEKSDFSGGSVSTVYNGHQVIIGLAMYGENLPINTSYYSNSDTAAIVYIDVFNKRHKTRIIPAFNLAAGEKGGFGSGLVYDMDYIGGWINVFESWATATGEVNITYGQNNRFRRTPYWWLYTDREYSPPAYGFAIEDTRKTWGGYGEINLYSRRFPLAAIAQRYNQLGDKNSAGLAEWLLQNKVSNNSSNRLLWDPLMIIFHDKSIQPLSPEELQLPLVDVFGDVDDYYNGYRAGMGMIFIRQKWYDPNGLVVVFKSSPRGYYGHQGAKDGAFSIAYKGSELALYDSGNYEDGGDHDEVYYDESLSINVVHFYNPLDGASTKFGGQMLVYANNYPNVGPANSYPGITKYENRDSFVFTETDLSKNYNFNKTRVNYYLRDFIWLKGEPGYFVIFDKIDVANSNDEKRWFLHTVDKPVIDGTPRVLMGSDNAGVIESTDTEIVRIDNGSGRLFVKALAPINKKTVLVGGPGYEFTDTKYVNHPLLKTNFQNDMGAWRMETIATEKVNKDNFLHILQPTDTSSNAMVETNLIESVEGKAIGTLIKDKVVIFSKENIYLTSTSFTVPGNGYIDFLISNLTPNKDYYYLINGQIVSISDSDNGGVKVSSSKYGILWFRALIGEAGLQGDVNQDGKVDIKDLIMVAKDFGKTTGFNPSCDLNNDNKVDIKDLIIVAKNFGRSL